MSGRVFTCPTTPKPLPPRIDAAATPAQLRARRQASYRLPPLECGCPAGPHADPLSCAARYIPPLTARALDDWHDAARHAIELGHAPLVPLDVRRALWRRGGTDRELAAELYELAGGD